ncbi:MAG: bifunctional demethylmenaquinone methyltransferase/2-methoxy-6-polyprenyl-1,4-benzoquinol methylase UbiE [Bacteroidetes bacterium]|nr:bifunctional demethylmenaquinone methyltransferase/2-methoxy-6-polyprenyl-1,4-benzoquinol methylase UbiE [Bacteroidota bacterium]
MAKTVVPYKDQSDSKRNQVEQMFNKIAPRYDFLNHFLSLGIDKAWRKHAIQLLKMEKPKSILDIATGTGDFAFESFNRIKPDRLVGVDISGKMLDVARKKLEKKNIGNRITFLQGDAEALNFESNTFDAATVAFGVRNFENLEKGLAEINRVLKPGGLLIVLEFGQPKKFPVKQLYHFYSKTILPAIGRLVSHDKAAYTYLPDSINAFPSGFKFIEFLHRTGFHDSFYQKLTFGIVNVYKSKKAGGENEE